MNFPKRKKICLVVAVPMTAAAFLQKHIEVLSSEFDVYLVANFEGVQSSLHQNPHLKGIYSAGIQRDIHIAKDFKGLMDLVAHFRRMQFDAVLSVTPKAGLLGMLAAWRADVPVRVHIFTGQVWHTQTGWFKKLLMGIDKLTAWLASDVLVDGQSQRKFLIENGIIKGSESQVLGKGSISGVDVNRFVPDAEIRAHWRKELGYSDKEVVFMFLGRLNVDKGILDLADAFEKVHQHNPDARLLLVGYDEENLVPEVRKKVSQPQAVHFFGPTSKPNELLQAADVFCLPSYREGFGTSVIEASLMEKPIVCSDTYGLQETIVEEETGLRHRVKDVQDLAQQMARLGSNAGLRQKMGENGRKYVMANFRADQISAAWLDFFRSKLQD